MTVFKCIVSYFKKHLFIFITLLIVIILVTILSLLPPQIISYIVDHVLPKEDKKLLLIFACFYMLTFLFIGIINIFKEWLLAKASSGISKHIRLNMLKHVNRMSYLNFTKLDSGSLEAYFTNDTESINTLITSGVISMLIDSLKIIGIIVSIFLFSYLFGFIVLGIVPVVFVFTMWIRKKMLKAQKENKKEEANVNNLVLESLDNITTIKSYRIYDVISSRYDNVLLRHFSANQRANVYDAIFSPIIQMFKTSIIVLIIILSTANGDIFGLSIGALVASIDLITDLFKPIDSVGMEIQTIQKSLASIKRINEFFLLACDSEKNQALVLDKDVTLEFKNVTFSYDGVNNVLENFNLVLKNNERLTILGESGSGKSTLFKLAYGLIKPTSGSVTLNGVDTYLLKDSVRRKYFGIVYQDYYFSNGTIKEEITLNDEGISDDRVYSVLKLVGLDRITDINISFNKNDYSYGELSLFNIARAIIFDVKILFLDEMNAKIDAVTAKKIINVIDSLSCDKMVLSINHYGDLLSQSKVIVLNK